MCTQIYLTLCKNAFFSPYLNSHYCNGHSPYLTPLGILSPWKNAWNLSGNL